MNRDRILLMLLLAVIALQLAVPASRIVHHEMALKTGRLYRFKVRFHDPADPFQGRYIQLAYDIDYRDDVIIHPDSRYAVLTVGEDGFAAFSEIRLTPPSGTADYLGIHMDRGTPRPFCDRFYLKETVAPEAEAFFIEKLRDSKAGVRVDMRVRKGHGVIEAVRIDGVPLLEAIR